MDALFYSRAPRTDSCLKFLSNFLLIYILEKVADDDSKAWVLLSTLMTQMEFLDLGLILAKTHTGVGE